jgi:carbonic anhydrase/acetyltransferase-like protein (isoleucine patch superfamily)
VALILGHNGHTPTIADDAFLASTAVLVGDVHVGSGASVWFGAVLRGDVSRIEVGADPSVQDNAVVHCSYDLPTVIGARVTIGHGAVLEGCVIEDGALVGMRATVLHHAVIGEGAIVAAGSVVPERMRVGARVLVAGVPAREKKPLDAAAIELTIAGSVEYGRIVADYRRAGHG